MAQDDDGLGLTITGGANLVSDYRFRGFSQSNEDWAIQGNVTVTHKSGAYAGFWGSSNQGQGEIDLIGGFSHEIASGIIGDIGVTYYLYPNRTALGTPGAGFTSGFKGSNELVEPYVSLSTTVGPSYDDDPGDTVGATYPEWDVNQRRYRENWCTVEEASRFFSFRRDGVTGRMAAAVWIERS